MGILKENKADMIVFYKKYIRDVCRENYEDFCVTCEDIKNKFRIRGRRKKYTKPPFVPKIVPETYKKRQQSKVSGTKKVEDKEVLTYFG